MIRPSAALPGSGCAQTPLAQSRLARSGHGPRAWGAEVGTAHLQRPGSTRAVLNSAAVDAVACGISRALAPSVGLTLLAVGLGVVG
jgi:hypothetical protein